MARSSNFLLEMASISFADMPDFAKGFAQGFFVEGALGNVTGAVDLAKMGWQTAKLICYLDPMCKLPIQFAGYDFTAEREMSEKILKAGEIAFQVAYAVNGAISNAIYEHVDALISADEGKLENLGAQHRKVAAALMTVAVELSKMAANMSAETKGKIFGQIVWEVAQTIAEVFLTAGVAAVATKSAKFIHIADKLTDLAKNSEGFGEAAQLVLKLCGEGGDLRKVLNKLDGASDSARALVKILCFTRDTLVTTDCGLKPIGGIKPGDRVRCFDFVAGEWAWGEVTKRHDNVYRGRIVSVHVGGSVIEATAGHPFWVLEAEDLFERAIPRELDEHEDEGRSLPGRWVCSHELRAGDVVIGVDGQERRIDRIAIREVDVISVSNLTVANQHTFAVGEAAILVHNSGAFCYAYERALKKVGLAVEYPADLIRAAERTGIKIHAHHLVPKTIPDGPSWASRRPFIEELHKLLERNQINKLGTTELVEQARNTEDLANMCWALNRDHSEDYLRALLKRLKQGETKDGRDGVLEGLAEVKKVLENGLEYRGQRL